MAVARAARDGGTWSDEFLVSVLRLRFVLDGITRTTNGPGGATGGPGMPRVSSCIPIQIKRPPTGPKAPAWAERVLDWQGPGSNWPHATISMELTELRCLGQNYIIFFSNVSAQSILGRAPKVWSKWQAWGTTARLPKERCRKSSAFAVVQYRLVRP